MNVQIVTEHDALRDRALALLLAGHLAPSVYQSCQCLLSATDRDSAARVRFLLALSEQSI